VKLNTTKGLAARFLFTNKQRDKIKVLYWDNTGALLLKSMELNQEATI
jgi:transposase